MGVRQFAVDDIPQVANLWWKVLRHRKNPFPRELLSYFQELYFTGPLADPDLPSLVYEGAKGRIVGFLGVVRRTMTLRGQRIRVAFGGNFVFQPEERSSLGGLKLLRDYMAGVQDLSETDSANDISKALLERLGFRTVVPLSIHWARPLRPAQYALYGFSKLAGPKLGHALQLSSTPFCAIADRMAARLSFSPLRQNGTRLSAAELDLDTLLHCLADFPCDGSIRPEYRTEPLKWLLPFMTRMHPHASLRKFVLRDESQKIVGWYIYYVKPGAIGQVVQVGGQKEDIKEILEHLFHDAWACGVAGLHGTVPYQMMAHYSEMNCIFTCHGGWTVVHSRNPELIELLSRGDASLSRLDGEWCLNFDE